MMTYVEKSVYEKQLLNISVTKKGDNYEQSCKNRYRCATYTDNELAGIVVNQASTTMQTSKLRKEIAEVIPNTEIISAKSQTGNTTGTGNHVDCLSLVTFSSDLSISEVQDKLDDTYEWNDLNCYVEETDKTGEYLFYLRKRAPFADNIIGH